jgi:hypothetical protein
MLLSTSTWPFEGAGKLISFGFRIEDAEQKTRDP